jgi:hypothetical protein
LRHAIFTAKDAKSAKKSQSNFRENPLRTFALLVVIQFFRNKN